MASASVESRQAQAELYESEKRFRQLVEGAPEEIAWRMGYISAADLERLADRLGKSSYGEYLRQLLREPSSA